MSSRRVPILFAAGTVSLLLMACETAPRATTDAASRQPATVAAPVNTSEAIETTDLAKLDQHPAPVFQVRPAYPSDLRRRGISGEVLVEFIVDTQGLVRNAHAVSATHAGFIESAVACVSQWRFRPGKKAGRPVNTLMQVPLFYETHDE